MQQDATPPAVHLTAAPAGDNIRVTWESTDSLSGVDDGACTMDVRTAGGAWEPHPVACAGAWDYGEPGHRYEFRFTAHDHVGNAASAVAQAGVPSVTKYYYHGGQRVALRKDGAVHYLHPDHLGSTSLTTDAAGNVVARRRYHPYGAERYVAGTLPTDVTYTGQRDVPGTGLMHYGARYYHPALGRFVSADTIVPDPGNPQSWNRYTYVLNNPHRYVDPDGRTPLLVTAAIGAGVGALVNTGFQIRETMYSNPGQVSFGEAFQQIDVGEVLGAAAAGGVMGLTLGAGSAILGTGFVATTYLGALGGGLGGQVGALTQATWDESVNLMNGAGFDGERFFNSAQEYRFLDLDKWGMDCTAGAISAGAGYKLTQFLGKWLNIPTGGNPDTMKKIVGIYPQKGLMVVQITDFSRSLMMPISKGEQLMQYLINGGYEVSEGFLEELLQTGVAEWVENQTS